ncbi:MAG: UDP-N-acetylglucosamine 2-epimerase (non-hydrolyzing) [Chloroflexi bacterium]|nr:UDP-N-acetylglucosamine 2-epimerase (non-hydrolyzing) [Chloroflexota bacterium]
MNPLRVLTILGTRPEAIKLAPVILELRKHTTSIQTRVCVTGQHRQMLDQALSLFGIIPDVDLDVMQPSQGLPGLTAKVMTEVSRVLNDEQPDVVLVQGDTTTVMAAALAAFYSKVAVGHVEAGLRSYDRYSPFPEEINRRITSVLATYHFAPTETARNALLNEGVAEAGIHVTGNTVIDALKMIASHPAPLKVRQLLDQAGIPAFPSSGPQNHRRLILVTAHRRENFGERFENICAGLKALVERNDNVVLIYPVHLNPRVREPVYRMLDHSDRIILVDPLEYDAMVHLMQAADLVLTDSGGIQEEAPALGKPVLVLRTETERPEAIHAGTAKLIGPDKTRIVEETERLLHDTNAYQAMAHAVSPYGDGQAAQKIVRVLLKHPVNSDK